MHNIVDWACAIVLAAILFTLLMLASGCQRAQASDKVAVALPVEAQGQSSLHVLSISDEGEVIAETVTSPLFAFKIESGMIAPGIHDCTQATEHRKVSEVDYPVIVLQCGEVKLALVGADLTVHK